MLTPSQPNEAASLDRSLTSIVRRRGDESKATAAAPFERQPFEGSAFQSGPFAHDDLLQQEVKPTSCEKRWLRARRVNART